MLSIPQRRGSAATWAFVFSLFHISEPSSLFPSPFTVFSGKDLYCLVSSVSPGAQSRSEAEGANARHRPQSIPHPSDVSHNEFIMGRST